MENPKDMTIRAVNVHSGVDEDGNDLWSYYLEQYVDGQWQKIEIRVEGKKK